MCSLVGKVEFLTNVPQRKHTTVIQLFTCWSPFVNNAVITNQSHGLQRWLLIICNYNRIFAEYLYILFLHSVIWCDPE